jgi:hypothetical protein
LKSHISIKALFRLKAEVDEFSANSTLLNPELEHCHIILIIRVI